VNPIPPLSRWLCSHVTQRCGRGRECRGGDARIPREPVRRSGGRQVPRESGGREGWSPPFDERAMATGRSTTGRRRRSRKNAKKGSGRNEWGLRIPMSSWRNHERIGRKTFCKVAWRLPSRQKKNTDLGCLFCLHYYFCFPEVNEDLIVRWATRWDELGTWIPSMFLRLPEVESKPIRYAQWAKHGNWWVRKK
jgi:hypothetical protein